MNVKYLLNENTPIKWLTRCGLPFEAFSIDISMELNSLENVRG